MSGPPGDGGWRGIDRDAPGADPIAWSLGSSYLLHEVLGQGATGEVWRGTHRPTGQAVAVKVLRPGLAADHDLVARFLRERAILTALRDPHLVGVRDLVAEGGTLAIVMDLVEGTDLRRFLAERGTLAPSLAARLMGQVLAALQVGHEAGVVHRDIKPENILLDLSDAAAPRALLSDFGIARLTQGPSLTNVKGTIGTPEYMAPELAEDGDAVPASDLYAVGIVLYELVAGRSPFSDGSPLQILRRQVDAVPARPPGMPDALWSVLEACLAKRPEDRPSSARQLARQLRGVADELAPLGPLPPAPAGSTMLATRRPADVQTPTPPAGPAPPVPPARPAPPPPARTREARGDGGEPEPSPAAPRPTFVPGAGASKRQPRGILARRARWGRRQWVVAGGVALVVLVAGGIGFVSRSRPNVTMTRSFEPVAANGLAVSRTWSTDLSGLRTTLKVVNTSAAPVTQTVDEVIPKSLARSVRQVRFDGTQPETVKDDPVVRYRLENVAPGATVEFTYRIAVQDVTNKRVEEWAGEQLRDERTHQTLGKLTLLPGQVSIAIGEVKRMEVRGTMRDGTEAPAAALAGAAWSSSAPTVAPALLGQVVGVTSGAAVVAVKVGNVEAEAHVVVQGQAPAQPAPTSPAAAPAKPAPAPAKPASVPPAPAPPQPAPAPPQPAPAPPKPAPVAGGCEGKNESVTDHAGNRFDKRYYCGTYTGSAVYGNITGSAALDDTGSMAASSRVWVICQIQGRTNPVIAGNTNTWWLYTQGDQARANDQGYAKGWGYLPATAVSQGGQNEPIPGVPTCPRTY